MYLGHVQIRNFTKFIKMAGKKQTFCKQKKTIECIKWLNLPPKFIFCNWGRNSSNKYPGDFFFEGALISSKRRKKTANLIKIMKISEVIYVKVLEKKPSVWLFLLQVLYFLGSVHSQVQDIKIIIIKWFKLTSMKIYQSCI